MYRFDAVDPIKPQWLFPGLGQKQLQSTWKYRSPQTAKEILKGKEDSTEVQQSTSLQIIYKARVTNHHYTGMKTKTVDQWTRIEYPEINWQFESWL